MFFYTIVYNMTLIVLEGKDKNKGECLKVKQTSKEETVQSWLNKEYEHPFTITNIGKSTHLRSIKGGFEL